MDIKNKIKAFSLVELVVWITISMILMASIWVFVNSGMSNIFLQQKSLQNASNINDFVKSMYENFSNIEEKKIYNIAASNQDIIFRSWQNLNTWWFTYIWISDIDWYYCKDTESVNTITKHMFIKNFIPYIENSETITNYSDVLESNYITYNWIDYKTIQKENIVVDNLWNTIIWNEIFWDKISSWFSWTLTQLNSPTWIATDSEVLYISDTLNDRILYMSWSNVYKLLDQNDWINEATWLFYDDINNELYISNSWMWEILKVSSTIYTNPPDRTFSFSWITNSWTSRFYISFFRNWLEYDISSSPIGHTNIELLWKNSIHDKIEKIDNKIEYSFRDELLNSSWAVVLDWLWNPMYTNRYESFTSSQTYNLEFKNLNNIFTQEWNYTIELEIWNSDINFYYYTQWDNKIYTQNNNKIEIVRSWLNYPNAIWWNPWSNSSPQDSNFNQFDISSLWTLSIDEDYDIILNTPIKNLNISENNQIINIITQYYKNYDCYNLDLNESKISTFISKFNVK